MIRSTRVRSSLVAVVCAALLFSSAAPAVAQAPNQIQIPIVGTVVGGGTFAGTFTLQRFVRDAGSVVAIGTVTGTLTPVTGSATNVVRNVALPVAITQATCDILHLDLGPLDLNLLGLQVNLSRIVLDIVAEAGAGNLLGNLLCAITGLLDNPSRLAQILNAILAILG